MMLRRFHVPEMESEKNKTARPKAIFRELPPTDRN